MLVNSTSGCKIAVRKFYTEIGIDLYVDLGRHRCSQPVQNAFSVLPIALSGVNWSIMNTGIGTGLEEVP
jgi:hypothetical protein